jgi:hypothetical protein
LGQKLFRVIIQMSPDETIANLTAEVRQLRAAIQGVTMRAELAESKVLECEHALNRAIVTLREIVKIARNSLGHSAP